MAFWGEDGFSDDDPFDELTKKLEKKFSITNVSATNKLYKIYSLFKKAHMVKIGKTLFYPKLNAISHRKQNPILEFENPTKKIAVTEGALAEAEIVKNKMVMEDSKGVEIKVEPIVLKNSLDNSLII